MLHDPLVEALGLKQHQDLARLRTRGWRGGSLEESLKIEALEGLQNVLQFLQAWQAIRLLQTRGLPAGLLTSDCY